jgi:hypothetical protein
VKNLLFWPLALLSLSLLAGCGNNPRPFSLEEKLWFHRAEGAEFNGVETQGHERNIQHSIGAVMEPYER